MSLKINICFLGDSECGKSSLINSFQNSFFDETQPYIPTIENKYSKLYTYDKQLYNINTHDTSGSLEMNCIVPDTIRQADAFVIVYSLSDRNSCDTAIMYKEMIHSCLSKKYYRNDDIPIILVGNKSDILPKSFTDTEIEELSKYMNLPYISSSSKDIQSVYSVYNLLLSTIEFKQKQLKKQQLKYDKLLQKNNNNHRGIFQKIIHFKLK